MRMPKDERTARVAGPKEPGRRRMKRAGKAVWWDPLYPQLQELLQEGRWGDAQTVLDVLERRHGGAAELERWRELLEMRLSAETTWANTHRQRLARSLAGSGQVLRGALRQRAVRALLVANLVVYLLLAAARLLGAWGYLPTPGL